MSVVIDGTSGVTTPGVVNTAGETIATTLVVSGTTTLTGVTTLTGGLNAALPVLSGGTGVTTSTGTGANVLGTSPTLTTPTFDSASLATISGTAPLYMCRAWVNFNGTGTVAISGSGNVSSITDNGTGDYTVNITTALVDANYSVVGMGKAAGSADGTCVWIRDTTTPTSSAVRIITGQPGRSGVNTSVALDNAFNSIAVFR